MEVTAMVLMKRQDGVLMGLPAGVMPEDEVAAGNISAGGGMLGQSTTFTIPSVVLDGGSLHPTGSTVSVLVVDFLSDVVAWQERGISLHGLLNARPPDAEQISHWLVVYGRSMYAAGKSSNKFSGTINSIAMLKPLLKRQLTPAWDVAFAWLADEPHEDHPALPVSILSAILSAALCWGWKFEAAVLGLAWAGLMRIGEVLQATRKDLVLWPMSAATLRNRFNSCSKFLISPLQRLTLGVLLTWPVFGQAEQLGC